MVTARKNNELFKYFLRPRLTILVGPCILLIACLSSCQYPHFYRPKPVEPVLLTHSHQSKVNLIADGDNFNAASISYSPAKDFGLSAGAGFLGDDGANGEKYFNPYLSAGYYRKLSLHTLIEAYGGIGLYNYKNNGDAALKKIKLYNYFIQPSFAFMKKDIEIALTVRMDYLRRYKTGTGNNYSPDISAPNFAFLKYNDYFFLQPGCTVRFGFRYFKFQVQASKSNPFNSKYASIYGMAYNAGSDREIFDHPIKWSSGITIDLDILKKRDPSKQVNPFNK